MMRISIAPVPYFWDLTTIRQFYHKIEQLPVDIVYLGETVCGKRRAVRLQDWLEIAQRLEDAGKEVVLSTLALMEAESELASLKHIVDNGKFLVEANDIAAVNLIPEDSSFVIGPHINVYNDRTLDFLHGLGARRWIIPVELPQQVFTDILHNKPPELEAEIIGFGRLALAFSARCFSARNHDLAKDACEFSCGGYADGMLLETRDQQPFLVINGIQVQSARAQNLVTHATNLEQAGINIFRIIPWLEGFEKAIAIIRDVLNRELAAEVATEQLRLLQPYGLCDGYFYGQAGMSWQA